LDSTFSIEILDFIFSETDTISICDGSSYLIFGNIESTTGYYIDTLNSVNSNCDSLDIKYLNLVSPIFIPTDTITICNGDSLLFAGSYISTPGLHSITLVSSILCDSTISTFIEVLPSYIMPVDSVDICFYDSTIVFGEYTSTQGLYMDTLTTINGCDSILQKYVEVRTVDISTVNENATISSNATNATFKWLDCLSSYDIISGAQSINFTALQNGDYAVEVTQNNCIDTSSCITISTIGLHKNNPFENISIVPNPSSGLISIGLGNRQNVSIVVYSSIGAIVFKDNIINSQEYQLELNEASGVYFIEISYNDIKEQFKLILE
jgi:hypothetical protein